MRDVRRVESGLLRHGDALEDLRTEHGFELPTFETVFDPSGDAELDEGAVLRVGAVLAGGRLALRLRYRTDAIDRDAPPASRATT